MPPERLNRQGEVWQDAVPRVSGYAARRNQPTEPTLSPLRRTPAASLRPQPRPAGISLPGLRTPSRGRWQIRTPSSGSTTAGSQNEAWRHGRARHRQPAGRQSVDGEPLDEGLGRADIWVAGSEDCPGVLNRQCASLGRALSRTPAQIANPPSVFPTDSPSPAQRRAQIQAQAIRRCTAATLESSYTAIIE